MPAPTPTMKVPEVNGFHSDLKDKTCQSEEAEPIAIIGLSVTFPQNMTSLDSLWEALAERKSAMIEFPKSRLNLEAFHDPDTERVNGFPLRGGHFIDADIGAFDAPFFSISPAEAAEMDPQQRGLLETSYKALESAGIPMAKAAGSNTAVYTGSFADDYKAIFHKDPENQAQYSASGVAPNMLANRISWFFNFNGPSINMDTACSSSLVALHLACQGLRNKEYDMALVGGCNLIFNPDMITALNNQNLLSPSSRCFSFDHRANGYARGEGFGIVVLKRVSDAIEQNDTIRAVIRATGSNQDGRTPGITQPSKAAQEQLIRNVYQKAGLSRDVTRYFEAHGTGTPVGDPIEAGAVGAAFGEYRSQAEPLYIGSVKANIGHLEGASGIAGVIKSVLILEKGMIPPNAGFERVNPNIKVEKWHLKFPLELTPWPTTGLRRVSVNSFGFGGTNAHAVLDDAYHYLRLRGIDGYHCTTVAQHSYTNGTANGVNTSHTLDDTYSELPSNAANSVNGLQLKNSITLEMPSGSVNGANGVHAQNSTESEVQPRFYNGANSIHARSVPKVLTFSAMDESGLKRLSSIYDRHFSGLNLTECSEGYLARLAHTLNDRRSSLLWRSFALAKSMSDLRGQELRLSRPRRMISAPRLAFCFTGQGAQWFAMGRELLLFPVFNNSLEDMDAYLNSLGSSWSLLDELCRDKASSKVNDSAYSQPLCTAIQIGLVDLLKSFQTRPVTVIGHSSGEIAAAYCAGALQRRSAIKVAYYRGTLTARVAKGDGSPGAMMSVGLSAAEIQGYLEKVTSHFDENGIAVGCINSPKNITITGREDQIDMLKGLMDEKNIFARKLLVNVAYHSRYLESITAEYLGLMGDLSSQHLTETPTMISSVTADLVTVDELRQGHYWVRNLLSPVRFSEALARACVPPAQVRRKTVNESTRPQLDDILEVGPHCALQGPIRETLKALPKAKSIEYSSTLVRFVSATESLLEALGRLHCGGHSIDISEINNQGSTSPRSLGMLADLPEYPFDHSCSYWRESRLSQGYRFRKEPRNDFLGIPVPDWNPLEARWRHKIRLVDSPWLSDHQIHGVILYPAAAMLVMAIEAARQMSRTKTDRSIKGYTIKDVTFQKSLSILPDAEGVEVEFHLRPLGKAFDRDISWSEFRLYVYENEYWAETCRGSIRLEYNEGTIEVDGGLESAEETRFYKRMLHEGRASCSKPGDIQHLYKTFEECGLGFGPAFQTLQNGWYNDKGEAIAHINLQQWLLKANKRHQQPNVIHPTALDGLLQLSFLALSQGGEKNIPSLVPTHIQKLWVSHTGLNDSSTSIIIAYNKSTFQGFREAESTVAALDASESKVQILIEGYGKVALGNKGTASATTSTPRRLCFNVDQRPDVELLDQKSFVAYSQSIFPAVPCPLDFFRDMKMTMCLFLLKTLEKMSSVDVESLKPHHRRYLRWMRHESEKLHASELSHGDIDWRKYRTDDHYLNDLCDRVERTNKTGKFYVEVGRNLYKILCGEVDPLDLFFSTDLVKDYYREFNKTTNGLNSFLIYLDALAHKRPDIKILEVGAGTGGVAGHILQTLTDYGEHESRVPRFSHYAYTDISPSFFEAAQSMFVDFHDRVSFKTLDIEKDPIYQGFEEEAYDMVIADNVLHATQNLDVTLRNVRKLLKPGGKIVLLELTEPDAMKTNFAFGLLPGWWRAADGYRDLSAGVSEDVWHKILVKAGFSGIDLSLLDYYEQECHEHSAMVSTALGKTPSQSIFPETLIIVDEGSPLQSEIKLRLKEDLIKMGSPAVHAVSLEQATQKQDINRMFCILLLEVELSVLRNVDSKTFLAIRDIITTTEGVLWITRGGGKTPALPDHAIINGLVRTVKQENIKMKFVTVSFESDKSTVSHFAETILKVYTQTISTSVDDCEPEYVEREGRLCIDRIVEADYLNRDIASRLATQQHQTKQFGEVPSLALSISSPGLLDTLEFVEDRGLNRPLDSDEIDIKVHASGVNFRDCLIALGRIPSTTMGFEGAGIVVRVGDQCKDLKPGDRVCANAAGTYQTYARCKAVHAMPLPEHMSFLEGAAIPVVFTTAYYALYHVARITDGESVLIHSGAGGTGQAAIQIAKLFNADIYVTVGSEEKKKLLMDLYNIPEDHIFYSRNASFAQGIKRMTRERGGVDIVLNSLSGDALVNTWQCMAPFGRFLEIGKKDILANGSLPMFPFAKNVSFHAIDLNEARQHRPRLMQDLKDGVVSLLFSGKIRPAQPLHVYGISEVEKAFRYLQSGRNTGKTVVELRQEDVVKTVLDIKPTWYLEECATYLISGGLGGIGRSIARWMIRHGAKNLILLSRFGPRNDAARSFLQALKNQGVRVEAPACDISNLELLGSVLAELAQKMPPIKGCIQSSMLLKDSIFDQMSYESWTEAIKPKVQGSYNLHALLPNDMDFFIMLSSIAGAIGSTTQANYAAGCSYQDALAHHRTGTGQKATTLNLGVMLDDGVLTENAKMKNILMSTGYLMGITQRELYALLEHHCNPSARVSAPLKTQVVVGVDVPASLKSRAMNPPTFMRRPPFRLFYNMSSRSSADPSARTTSNDINIATLLSHAASLPEAASIISDALMRKLSKALAVPLENLEPSQPMHAYGVDSLVAVELRNWFAHTLDADVAVFEILGGASFDDVGALVAGKSRVVAAAPGEGAEGKKEGGTLM